MLIQNEDGTFIAGPLDVLCILHDKKKGSYHAALLEEDPFPGPVPDIRETKIVRLKSKMHHTQGASTLEEAKKHLKELSERVKVPEGNIWDNPSDSPLKPYLGSWSRDDYAFVVVVPNWRKQ